MVEPGDVVLVQVGELPKDHKAVIPAKLDQDPEVQGAFVAIDPVTRNVLALVGGSDFNKSKFNRATQAHRQPGSSFKPYVWAAAFSTPKYTPASIVVDAPELIRDPWTGKEWKPVNFEKDSFDGPMTLRQALAESKNTIAVRLIEDLGPDAVIDMARRAGIASPIPQNFTIALGTAEVTPLEHANAYATLAAGGKRADPILLLKVTDHSGQVLESHTAQPQETIPPAVAFLTTAVMQSVITDDQGTGRRAMSSEPAARGQDRHRARSARRVVRGLLAGPRRGRVDGLRQPRSHGPRRDRRARRAAHVDGVHAAGAQGSPGARLRAAAGDHQRAHRSSERKARRRRVLGPHGILRRRHAAQGSRSARRWPTRRTS